MQLDNTGNPYLGFVVIDNLNGAYGNDLEYYYAHLSAGAWQVDRVGFAGLPLYNGQNQYAGLLAVDPLNPNRIFFSADVNPATNAALLGPDSKQHWQIFEGNTTTNGAAWSFTQLTNTPSDNLRPVIAASPDGNEGLTWMRGTYTAYTNFNSAVVGLVIPTTAVSLTWNSTASSAWNVNGAFNWSNGASTSAFFNGNNITFPDGPALQPNITLNTTVTPSTITVTSNTINYTLSGTGAIAGATTLTKSGTSTLTLATPNTYSGGTILSAGTLIAAHPQALGTGPITIHTNATLQFQANLPTALIVPALIFDGTTGNWSGTLDVTNNKLIIQDSLTHATSLATLQSQSHSVITSTALPANYAIAILDNALLNKTTFGGVAVNANSILIAPELLGDTNADGTIDLTDLSTVLNNFGASTLAWTSGNFDGSPTINLTDLSDVLNNFGLTNPAASAQLPITNYQLPTPTPEPTTLTLLLAARSLLLRPPPQVTPPSPPRYNTPMQHAPLIKLSREIRFALHNSSQPTPPNSANSFAAEPALLDIAPFLTLTATLGGPIDPATGMLINIKNVDKILRQHAIPTLRDGYLREPPAPRTRPPPQPLQKPPPQIPSPHPRRPHPPPQPLPVPHHPGAAHDPALAQIRILRRPPPPLSPTLRIRKPGTLRPLQQPQRPRPQLRTRSHHLRPARRHRPPPPRPPTPEHRQRHHHRPLRPQAPQPRPPRIPRRHRQQPHRGKHRHHHLPETHSHHPHPRQTHPHPPLGNPQDRRRTHRLN